MPIQFNVNPNTRFINRDGTRVPRGDWQAPWFKYITDNTTHTQWLILSNQAYATFKGVNYQMERRECPIKGEETFDKPGTYALQYKKLV